MATITSSAMRHKPVASHDTTGIFGYISNGGQIRNLGVEDVNMTGRSGIGGLVGFNESGSITNCYSTGSLSGFSHIGGLVGTNGGSITSSYSTASVSGYDHVGGLVGAGHIWFGNRLLLDRFC